jgi:hypothetical protein|tara:strand:- start:268 stop:468 length:201 start_codon:yes stop_codon:yes gene_type:complete
MQDKEFLIIACPKCEVKNRIKTYNSEKLPVCAKCKTHLIDPNSNEAHSRYGKNLGRFYNLPDIGLR